MRQTLGDFRHAVRTVRMNGAFALFIVITLAIGIGANTALFSVVDAVLLRPLPFERPAELVAVWETGARKSRVAPANFLDWRRDARSFSGMAAFNAAGFTMTLGGEAERVGGATVSAGYFDVLGVHASAGRLFAERDHAPGEPVVVLGHELWTRRFSGDVNVVGKTVTLDGVAYTIVGVAPPGLYPSWPTATGRMSFAQETQQVFVPMRMDARRAANRNSHVMGVVARLKDGVDMKAASEEMASIGKRLAALYPATNQGESALVTPLSSEVVGSVRPALIALLAAVGVLLALACANVASVLLARATAREREIAVRRALGASGFRIARLVIAENVVLASLGGVAGCALAAALVPVLITILPSDLPRLSDIAVNGRVLLFALAASMATAFGFGLGPAVQAGMTDPSRGLRSGSAGSGDARGLRARRGLVIAQVALALVLVTAGTMLGRSFENLLAVDPGFEPEGVLSFHLVLPQRYASPPQVVAAFNELLTGFHRLPGVAEATLAYDLPLESNWIDPFEIEGATEPPAGWSAHLAIVGPAYFKALGATLKSGRPIDERDTLGASGSIVVSASFASRFFPGQVAEGRWLRLSTPSGMNGPDAPTRFQIVGVAEDVHSVGIAKAPEPTYYVSALQFPQRDMSVLMRVAGDPISVLPSVRREIQRFDSTIALSNPTTLDRVLDTKVAQPRFNTVVLAIFATTAVALTAVGLYGLLSYSVARRRREIGVRLALGASPPDIRRMIVREGLRLVGAGIGLGVIGALLGTSLIASLLFGVESRDPVSFVTGTLALLICGAFAALMPARLAASVTPVSALRED